jgi:hypothetical protein
VVFPNPHHPIQWKSPFCGDCPCTALNSKKCGDETLGKIPISRNVYYMPGIIIVLKYSGQFFLFNWDGENVSEYSVFRNYLRKYMRNGKNNAIVKKVLPKSSPGLGENDGKIISTWNFGYRYNLGKGVLWRSFLIVFQYKGCGK